MGSSPKPGSPEFLELVRRTRQRIFDETGVWVDAVDIGSDDARDDTPERKAAAEPGVE